MKKDNEKDQRTHGENARKGKERKNMCFCLTRLDDVRGTMKKIWKRRNMEKKNNKKTDAHGKICKERNRKVPNECGSALQDFNVRGAIRGIVKEEKMQGKENVKKKKKCYAAYRKRCRRMEKEEI